MTAQHTRTTLAGGACLTLGVAMAVAIGAVPRLAPAHAAVGQPVVVHHVAMRTPAHEGAAAARVRVAKQVTAAHHHAARHSGAAAATATATHRGHHAAMAHVAHVHGAAAAVASSADSTGSAVETRHRRHHHKHGHHHHARRHHHATSSPKPAAPATPTKAARTHPSAAAVQDAINGLKKYVHSILTPTAAQVAQFGDMVCTAFDQGNTYAHIKSVILSKVSSLPLTTVLPGAADYVVTTAVKLYCPGYTSKLG